MACSRLTQANGRPASTSISFLVQPAGCSPAMKKAAQTRRQRSTGSDGNDQKEEKSFYADGSSIDFRGHLAVRPDMVKLAAYPFGGLLVQLPSMRTRFSPCMAVPRTSIRSASGVFRGNSILLLLGNTNWPGVTGAAGHSAQ